MKQYSMSTSQLQYSAKQKCSYLKGRNQQYACIHGYLVLTSVDVDSDARQLKVKVDRTHAKKESKSRQTDVLLVQWTWPQLIATVRQDILIENHMLVTYSESRGMGRPVDGTRKKMVSLR